MFLFKHISEYTAKRISENTSLRASQIHALNDDNELFPDKDNDFEIISMAMEKIKPIFFHGSKKELFNSEYLVILNSTLENIFSFIRKETKLKEANLLNDRKMLIFIEKESSSISPHRSKVTRYTFHDEIPNERKEILWRAIEISRSQGEEFMHRLFDIMINAREAVQSIIGSKMLVICGSRTIKNAQYFIDSKYSIGEDHLEFGLKDKKTKNESGLENNIYELSKDRSNRKTYRSEARYSIGRRHHGGLLLKIKINNKILSGLEHGVSIHNVQYIDPSDYYLGLKGINYNGEVDPPEKAKIRLTYKFSYGKNNESGKISTWSEEQEYRVIVLCENTYRGPATPSVASYEISKLINFENYQDSVFTSDDLTIHEYSEFEELHYPKIPPSRSNVRPLSMAIGKKSGIVANLPYAHIDLNKDKVLNARSFSLKNLSTDAQKLLINLRDIDFNKIKISTNNNTVRIAYKNSLIRNGSSINMESDFTVTKDQIKDIVVSLLMVDSIHSAYYYSKLEVFKANLLISKLISENAISRFEKVDIFEHTEDKYFWWNGLDNDEMLYIGRRSSTRYGRWFSCLDINPFDMLELYIAMEFLKETKLSDRITFDKEIAYLANNIYTNREENNLIDASIGKALVALDPSLLLVIIPFTDKSCHDEITRTAAKEYSGSLATENIIHRFKNKNTEMFFDGFTLHRLDSYSVYLNTNFGIAHILSPYYRFSIISEDKSKIGILKSIASHDSTFRRVLQNDLSESPYTP